MEYLTLRAVISGFVICLFTGFSAAQEWRDADQNRFFDGVGQLASREGVPLVVWEPVGGPGIPVDATVTHGSLLGRMLHGGVVLPEVTSREGVRSEAVLVLIESSIPGRIALDAAIYGYGLDRGERLWAYNHGLGSQAWTGLASLASGEGERIVFKSYDFDSKENSIHVMDGRSGKHVTRIPEPSPDAWGAGGRIEPFPDLDGDGDEEFGLLVGTSMGPSGARREARLDIYSGKSWGVIRSSELVAPAGVVVLHSTCACLDDLNGDGLPEIFAHYRKLPRGSEDPVDAGSPWGAIFSVGGGTLLESRVIENRTWSWWRRECVLCEDCDGDGARDLMERTLGGGVEVLSGRTLALIEQWSPTHGADEASSGRALVGARGQYCVDGCWIVESGLSESTFEFDILSRPSNSLLGTMSVNFGAGVRDCRTMLLGDDGSDGMPEVAVLWAGGPNPWEEEGMLLIPSSCWNRPRLGLGR